jgi:hypothetical protein
VQARHHQHVVHSRLLKGRDNFGIHEAAIAQQHGSQHGGAFRLAGKKPIEPCQQIRARPRQPLRP